MTYTCCYMKCCSIQIENYITVYKPIVKRRRRTKAGMFIYDPKLQKVLLVQSRNRYWGFPKGSVKEGETVKGCAIREVTEETGLVIPEDWLVNYFKVKGFSFYYYVELPEQHVSVQDHIKNNDANGITWIKLECLKELIKSGKMLINMHCKIMLEEVLGINCNLYTHPVRRSLLRKQLIEVY